MSSASATRVSFLARNVTRGVAVVLVVSLYFAAQLPQPSSDERAALARRFDFKSFELPHPDPCDHSRLAKNVLSWPATAFLASGAMGLNSGSS